MFLILQKVAATIGWTVLGVLLLYGGIRLYDYLDPIDYKAEIRQGNVAAGIKLATVVAALAAIIVAVLVT